MELPKKGSPLCSAEFAMDINTEARGKPLDVTNMSCQIDKRTTCYPTTTGESQDAPHCMFHHLILLMDLSAQVREARANVQCSKFTTIDKYKKNSRLCDVCYI